MSINFTLLYTLWKLHIFFEWMKYYTTFKINQENNSSWVKFDWIFSSGVWHRTFLSLYWWEPITKHKNPKAHKVMSPLVMLWLKWKDRISLISDWEQDVDKIYNVHYSQKFSFPALIILTYSLKLLFQHNGYFSSRTNLKPICLEAMRSPL